MPSINIYASRCRHFIYRVQSKNHRSNLPLDRSQPYCPECLAGQTLHAISIEAAAVMSGGPVEHSSVYRAQAAREARMESDLDARDRLDLAAARRLQINPEDVTVPDLHLTGNATEKARTIRNGPGDRTVQNALAKVRSAIAVWDSKVLERARMVEEMAYAFGVAELDEVLVILDASGHEKLAEHFR